MTQRPDFPLDPARELVETVRRDAEAAVLARHQGLLKHAQGWQCGALVLAAVQVVYADCDMRGTTPAERLKLAYADAPEALANALHDAQITLARIHHARLLERALVVLDSPDSTCPRTADIAPFPEGNLEILHTGQWRPVLDLQPRGFGDFDTWMFLLEDGDRLDYGREQRVWVRASRNPAPEPKWRRVLRAQLDASAGSVPVTVATAKPVAP